MKTSCKLIHVALALVMSNAVQAEPSDTLRKIKDTGVINLGGRDASFPFSYKVSADGNPIGFSADLCMKVVDAVRAKIGLPNLKVQYTIVTPANRIALVQNGTVDLECSTTTNTVARSQQVEFAPTHFVGSMAVIVKKLSGIQNFSQLSGKTVATVTGSTAVPMLRNYRRTEKLDISEISGKDTAETFLMLAGDRATAMLLEDVQLAGLIATARNPGDFVLLDERLRDEPYGFMFRKEDPQFKALVDEVLTKLMKSKEIDLIYSKWFTQPVPPNNVNLNYAMPSILKQAYQNPNNRGI